jgi:EAL domain-containing protein (putative c-di-GMP-specific phosphodiesterase class I)
VNPASTAAGRILLVDDEPFVLSSYTRLLRTLGYEVETAADGREAVDRIARGAYDVVVSDIAMPGLDGLALLRAVRERDLDVPVVLMTGGPDLHTAVAAVEYGAFRYLLKPVEIKDLQEALGRAIRLHAMARLKREALQLYAGGGAVGDRAGLEASFARALEALWMAFQPVVAWGARRTFGYEALVRTGEASLANPADLLSAAERLERLPALGRAIRASVARAIEGAAAEALFLVNLHPLDLADESLFDAGAPLSRFAARVVLEITERAALDRVRDLAGRVAALRKLGYRIAVDDLGAGYAGLSSFARLEPELVKLDMSLVRDVHRTPTKRKLIGSMAALCRDLGMQVIAEGVETADERDTLAELGCDLLQGYLFAKPGRPFPAPSY